MEGYPEQTERVSALIHGDTKCYQGVIKRFPVIFMGTKNGFAFCHGVYKGLRRIFQENLKRSQVIRQERGVVAH